MKRDRHGRPIVLVDMDGPLANFDLQFYNLCMEKGWEWDAPLEQQRHRFGTDHIILGHHQRAARRHIHKTRWFLDLPVMPGAYEGLHELAEHADVWIATKPLEDNRTCRDDKATWLARNFGPEWVRKMFIAPDKSMLNGSILLDDAINPDWPARASWNPVIFEMTWNGDGSKWEGWDRWTWGKPVEDLLAMGSAG